MAVLETIRVKFGILITVLIAVALLSFIIDPSSLSMFGADQAAQETEVASINGTGVTYSEFHDKVRMYNDMYPYEMYEASVLNSNPEANTSDLKKSYDNEIRAMVMQDLLMNNLYVNKAKAAGFSVSEEEMYQLLSGKIYSQTIASQFQGQMTPELLLELESTENPMWDNVKKATENERYLSKYTTVFAKSMFSNSLLVEDDIQNSNNVFNVEFVMVPYEVGRDTSIVVTAEEINNYYESHKKFFAREEIRNIDYVVVNVNEETEDAEYEKIDSVLHNVKTVELFRQALADKGYVVDSTPVYMTETSFGSVSGVENVVKWAFKEEIAGNVSEIFTVNDEGQRYLVVAALAGIEPAGYAPVEDPQVRVIIESELYAEKVSDKKLADVTEKINGLTDIKAVSEAFGIAVNSKDRVTFAASDNDQSFAGAASVAEVGVLNTPVKGAAGVYVYVVTDRSEEAFFTEESAKTNQMRMNYMYSQVLSNVINQEGNIKDYTYLYF